jgi:shikimate kinase
MPFPISGAESFQDLASGAQIGDREEADSRSGELRKGSSSLDRNALPGASDAMLQKPASRPTLVRMSGVLPAREAPTGADGPVESSERSSASKIHVTLVGMPSVGKTTIGLPLAKQLGMPFIDADQEIELREGRKVKDIFRDDGESAFREIEERVVLDLLDSKTPSVISTGGGAVLSETTRRALPENSTTLYLQISPEALADRLKGDTTRPLMQGHDPRTRVDELYGKRHPLYQEAADFMVDVTGHEPEPIVDVVAQGLNPGRSGREDVK